MVPLSHTRYHAAFRACPCLDLFQDVGIGLTFDPHHNCVFLAVVRAFLPALFLPGDQLEVLLVGHFDFRATSRDLQLLLLGSGPVPGLPSTSVSGFGGQVALQALSLSHLPRFPVSEVGFHPGATHFPLSELGGQILIGVSFPVFLQVLSFPRLPWHAA